MSMIPNPEPDYSDGRTKQSFKDATDINRILTKWQKTGVISHLSQYGAEYGDFSDIPDLLEAQGRLARGQAIFDALPSEVRAEFNQSVSDFFLYVNDPSNKDRLKELLPDLAAPGRQHRALDPKIQQGIQEAFEAAAAAGQSSDSSESSSGTESSSSADSSSSEGSQSTESAGDA